MGAGLIYGISLLAAGRMPFAAKSLKDKTFEQQR
jgi:hypothetical protein